MFNKLFKPTAPKQSDFSPEAGHRMHFTFPKTDAQLAKENTQGHAVTLAVAVSRIQEELQQLRAVIECGQGRRAVGVIMAEVSRTKDLIEIHRVAREQAQAKARAGLILEKEILPSLHQEERTRDTLGALNRELLSTMQANEAAVSLAALLAQVQ